MTRNVDEIARLRLAGDGLEAGYYLSRPPSRVLGRVACFRVCRLAGYHQINMESYGPALEMLADCVNIAHTASKRLVEVAVDPDKHGKASQRSLLHSFSVVELS